MRSWASPGTHGGGPQTWQPHHQHMLSTGLFTSGLEEGINQHVVMGQPRHTLGMAPEHGSPIPNKQLRLDCGLPHLVMNRAPAFDWSCQVLPAT